MEFTCPGFCDHGESQRPRMYGRPVVAWHASYQITRAEPWYLLKGGTRNRIRNLFVPIRGWHMDEKSNQLTSISSNKKYKNSPHDVSPHDWSNRRSISLVLLERKNLKIYPEKQTQQNTREIFRAPRVNAFLWWGETVSKGQREALSDSPESFRYILHSIFFSILLPFFSIYLFCVAGPFIFLSCPFLIL